MFIEASVYAEYKVFDLNKKSIINGDFKFNAAKSINVFSFIQEIINIGNISITEFKKPSEIKDFMLKHRIFDDSINEINNDEQLKSEVIEILVNQLYVEKTE